MVYHAVLEVTPMGKANSIFVPLRFINTNTVFAKADNYDPNFGRNNN